MMYQQLKKKKKIKKKESYKNHNISATKEKEEEEEKETIKERLCCIRTYRTSAHLILQVAPLLGNLLSTAAENQT